MNDDRIQSADAEKKLPKPEVYIVRNGDAVFKPGMKTWFVETGKQIDSEDGSEARFVKEAGVRQSVSGRVITEEICVCNKVCTCEGVCASYTPCSCVSVPPCACVHVTPPCSCNSYSGGGGVCTCNKICTCVPVPIT